MSLVWKKFYLRRLCQKTHHISSWKIDTLQKSPVWKEIFIKMVMTNFTSHHEKLRSYKCHLCEKSFGQKWYVKIHISTVHEKLKSYKCH